MKIGEAAKKLGVSVKTLQRWDEDGVLIALRNPKNQRYYTNEQIENVMSKSNDWDVYRLFYADNLVDLCGLSEEEYQKAIDNEEQSLYTMVNEQIAYKLSNTKEVASFLNINEQILVKRSIDLKEYLGYFDGGEYIEIMEMQITRSDCIDYICRNINVYFKRIEKIIEEKKEFDDEILSIINEVLVTVVKEEVEECIKELRKRSKGGNFEWK